MSEVTGRVLADMESRARELLVSLSDDRDPDTQSDVAKIVSAFIDIIEDSTVPSPAPDVNDAKARATIPFAWHCVGHGDGWHEDKIVRDGAYVKSMLSQPDSTWVVTPLYTSPAPDVNEGTDWKRAFAAQSRKLHAVLHIPGVREEFAALEWPDQTASAEASRPPNKAVMGETWRKEIIHPNNRLLFKRMVEKFGIDLTTDDIASGLEKVALSRISSKKEPSDADAK